MTYFTAPGTVKELNPETINKIFDNPTWDKFPQKYGKKLGGHGLFLKKSATMYLLRNRYTFQELAKLFGYNSRSNVLKTTRSFKGWLDCNDALAQKALEDAETLLFNSRIIYE